MYPLSRNSFDMVASLIGRPAREDDGNTKSEPSRSVCASRSTSIATLDSGMRCSAFAFILAAGMRHSLASKPNSAHTAFRTSPLRVAVSTSSLNASFVESAAPDSGNRLHGC